MSLRVAICITTHHRRAEFDRTLAQVDSLTPQATGGTVQFVQERNSVSRLPVPFSRWQLHAAWDDFRFDIHPGARKLKPHRLCQCRFSKLAC